MTTRKRRLSEPTGSTRYAGRIPSPVGTIWVVTDEAGALVRLDFDGGRGAPDDEEHLARLARRQGLELAWDPGRVRGVACELAAYFDGASRVFDLEVAPSGTAFQLRVWRALLDVPFGETRSYGELARAVGSPGSARAVGRANGTNPVALVIPCHRVIGADGSLTGYGGGMARKRALLEHEGDCNTVSGTFLHDSPEPSRQSNGCLRIVEECA